MFVPLGSPPGDRRLLDGKPLTGHMGSVQAPQHVGGGPDSYRGATAPEGVAVHRSDLAKRIAGCPLGRVWGEHLACHTSPIGPRHRGAGAAVRSACWPAGPRERQVLADLGGVQEGLVAEVAVLADEGL